MDIKIESIFSYNYHEGSYFKNYATDTNELIYFFNGEGTTTIDGENFDYASNYICFSKAYALKHNISRKKTDYICIRFYGDMENHSLKNGIFLSTDNDILQLFIEIQKEYSLKKSDYFEICNLKINELILKIVRSLMIDNSNSEIYKLIRRLDRDKVFNISVSDMAIETSYSYDRFRHIFKELTGKSPTDYIINKRIEYACELLKDTEYSCTQISQLCGFATSAQFSAIFKKKLGINPKRYSAEK